MLCLQIFPWLMAEASFCFQLSCPFLESLPWAPHLRPPCRTPIPLHLNQLHCLPSMDHYLEWPFSYTYLLVCDPFLPPQSASSVGIGGFPALFLLCPQCLPPSLAHIKTSNIHCWVNEWMVQPRPCAPACPTSTQFQVLTFLSSITHL